jgi:hypothetical protein
MQLILGVVMRLHSPLRCTARAALWSGERVTRRVSRAPPRDAAANRALMKRGADNGKLLVSYDFNYNCIEK